mmetsp:Transcript_9393/g.29819  ORF Transcript_9393/g.29819 Transcript_9393/m.29819 type:complete len:211 (-) Transcript_9393:451-1083(-)
MPARSEPGRVFCISSPRAAAERWQRSGRGAQSTSRPPIHARAARETLRECNHPRETLRLSRVTSPRGGARRRRPRGRRRRARPRRAELAVSRSPLRRLRLPSARRAGSSRALGGSAGRARRRRRGAARRRTRAPVTRAAAAPGSGRAACAALPRPPLPPQEQTRRSSRPSSARRSRPPRRRGRVRTRGTSRRGRRSCGRRRAPRSSRAHR